METRTVTLGTKNPIINPQVEILSWVTAGNWPDILDFFQHNPQYLKDFAHQLLDVPETVPLTLLEHGVVAEVKDTLIFLKSAYNAQSLHVQCTNESIIQYIIQNYQQDYIKWLFENRFISSALVLSNGKTIINYIKENHNEDFSIEIQSLIDDLQLSPPSSSVGSYDSSGLGSLNITPIMTTTTLANQGIHHLNANQNAQNQLSEECTLLQPAQSLIFSVINPSVVNINNHNNSNHSNSNSNNHNTNDNEDTIAPPQLTLSITK